MGDEEGQQRPIQQTQHPHSSQQIHAEQWRCVLGGLYGLSALLQFIAMLTAHWINYSSYPTATDGREFALGLVQWCDYQLAGGVVVVDACSFGYPPDANSWTKLSFACIVISIVFILAGFFATIWWCACRSLSLLAKNSIYPAVVSAVLGVFFFPISWSTIQTNAYNGGIGAAAGAAYQLPAGWSIGYSYALNIAVAGILLTQMIIILLEPEWPASNQFSSMFTWVTPMSPGMNPRRATVSKDWNDSEYTLNALANLSANPADTYQRPQQVWVYDEVDKSDIAMNRMAADGVSQTVVTAPQTELQVPNFYLLIGGPGSSSTTYGAMTAARFRMQHIDVRSEYKRVFATSLPAMTANGDSALMSAVLALISQLITQRLSTNPDRNNFLFTGFPITLDQELAFEQKFGAPTYAVYLNCSVEELVSRIVKAKSSSIDDGENAQSIEERVRLTLKDFPDLLASFHRSGKLSQVDANGDIAQVFPVICDVFEKLFVGGKSSMAFNNYHHTKSDELTLTAAAAEPEFVMDMNPDAPSISSFVDREQQVQSKRKLWVPMTVRKRAGLGVSAKTTESDIEEDDSAIAKQMESESSKSSAASHSSDSDFDGSDHHQSNHVEIPMFDDDGEEIVDHEHDEDEPDSDTDMLADSSARRHGNAVGVVPRGKVDEHSDTDSSGS